MVVLLPHTASAFCYSPPPGSVCRLSVCGGGVEADECCVESVGLLFVCVRVFLSICVYALELGAVCVCLFVCVLRDSFETSLQAPFSWSRLEVLGVNWKESVSFQCIGEITHTHTLHIFPQHTRAPSEYTFTNQQLNNNLSLIFFSVLSFLFFSCHS